MTTVGLCDRCRKADQARRPSREARGYGSRWRRLSEGLTRQVGSCQQCGWTGGRRNPLTLDHVLPKARGGGDERANLRVLCRRCNSARSARAKA